MIKIRYRDPNELSPGLHAAAERHGRSTTVYLLSGLTAAERRAALRRLRLSARMGYCPRLPAAQLAVALFADRIRTGASQGGAVFRSHPAGSTVPVMVVSAGAIAFMLLSTVSIHVLRPGRITDQLPPSLPAPSAIAGPGPGWSYAPVTGGLGDQGSFGSEIKQLTSVRTGFGGSAPFSGPAILGFGTGSGLVTGAGSADGTGTTTGTSTGSGSGGGTDPGTPGSTPTPAPSTTSDPSAIPSAIPSGIPSTIPSGIPSTIPSGIPSTTSSGIPSASPSSTATAQPQPTGTASPGGGLCLNMGPLGVCLNL